jgi:hypothetical protein
MAIINIQGVPGGNVDILGGHSIGHSKQKNVYVHVSYSERFPGFFQNQATFRRNMAHPSSWPKNKPRKKPAALCLPPDLTLVSFLAYFSTLKMEAVCSS